MHNKKNLNLLPKILHIILVSLKKLILCIYRFFYFLLPILPKTKPSFSFGKCGYTS